MLWLCPAGKLFWTEVCKLISVIINVNVAPCPSVCVLGHRAAQLKTRQERKTVGLALLAAKRKILSNWKINDFDKLENAKPKCFSIETWIF